MRYYLVSIDPVTLVTVLVSTRKQYDQNALYTISIHLAIYVHMNLATLLSSCESNNQSVYLYIDIPVCLSFYLFIFDMQSGVLGRCQSCACCLAEVLSREENANCADCRLLIFIS